MPAIYLAGIFCVNIIYSGLNGIQCPHFLMSFSIVDIFVSVCLSHSGNYECAYCASLIKTDAVVTPKLSKAVFLAEVFDKEIAKTEGKWYDMYVKYATDNGLIEEGQFTNFDRNIMRYEMAVMFAKTMPELAFAPKNSVKAIPDVNSAEEYHDELMLLYNAGVLMGSTEYGDFLATIVLA